MVEGGEREGDGRDGPRPRRAGDDPRARSACQISGRSCRIASLERRAKSNSRAARPVRVRGPMRVIGLMSGTSADGVDAALVEWPPGEAARPFRLLAQREDPFPAELQQRIHALAAGRCPPGAALRELAALDVALGDRFAEAAIAVAHDAGVALDGIDRDRLARSDRRAPPRPRRHAPDRRSVADRRADRRDHGRGLPPARPRRGRPGRAARAVLPLRGVRRSRPRGASR